MPLCLALSRAPERLIYTETATNQMIFVNDSVELYVSFVFVQPSFQAAWIVVFMNSNSMK